MTAEAQIMKVCPSRPLLFINKDATNLNRAPAEAFAIGSHVSKAHRNWSRSVRLRRTEVTALHRTHNVEFLGSSDPNDSERPPKHEYQITRPDQHDKYDSNDSMPVSNSSDSFDPGQEGDTAESALDDGCPAVGRLTSSKTCITSSILQTSCGPLANRRTSSLLSIGCKDTFSTITRIKPADSELLNLSRNFHVFPARPARASRLFREQLHRSYDIHLAKAVEDEAVYHGLLAAGLMVMSLVSFKDRHHFTDKAHLHKPRQFVS